mmetsp:Transcript_31121/g.92728  ORF Transcript_31121/g.92728 Transcript_31121/m.92728 type:complete len:236 (-) Transcript_31121:6695-7402(-)
MLMAHSHRPAAARDLVQIASRLKCSSARYGRVASTVFFDTWPASITFLKSLSRSRNLSTLPMSFCAACHDLSLGLPSSRMITTAVISSTPAGGFLSDFASPKSFLLSVSSAASACATSGSAAARSFSHDACFSDTSLAITAHFSASTCAAAFSTPTFSFSTPTCSANTLALATLCSTSTAMTFAASISTSTSACTFCSLFSPLSSRSMLSCVAWRFLPSTFLYSLMSSRNVLGVV